MEKKALRLDSKDNVATALEAMEKGSKAAIRGDDGRVETIELLEDIPFGFKFATQSIISGAPIVKYGELIGVASVAISVGSLVHIHNVEGTRGRGDVTSKGEKA
jgi:altronate dehydratase small subunit